MLPITSKAHDSDQAQIAMGQLLPRALLNCMDSYDNEEQNALFESLSYLLLTQLGVIEVDDPAWAVQPPTPTVDDAPAIWRRLERC
jgi:hypothetical protein